MPESHTSVLIVGGGPVGLTLSCLLSGHGVDHVLIEAHPAASRHPKARGVSARSMEIFRRVGLEQAVRAAGLPAEQVRFYRGRDLVDPDHVRTGPAREPGEGPEHTPSPGLICSQDALEPVLLRRAEEQQAPGSGSAPVWSPSPTTASAYGLSSRSGRAAAVTGCGRTGSSAATAPRAPSAPVPGSPWRAPPDWGGT